MHLGRLWIKIDKASGHRGPVMFLYNCQSNRCWSLQKIRSRWKHWCINTNDDVVWWQWSVKNETCMGTVCLCMLCVHWCYLSERNIPWFVMWVMFLFHADAVADFQNKNASETGKIKTYKNMRQPYMLHWNTWKVSVPKPELLFWDNYGWL